MRVKPVIAILCSVVLMWGMNVLGAAPKGVILVMTDDTGYGDINALEESNLQTPQLDRLYAESVRFTDFHVGTTCSPTRGSLMTGRHVNAGGVFHTISGRSRLVEGEQTMADVFKANGWRTGIFGKWHLGEGFPYFPRYRGFEKSVIHGGGGVSQMPDYWGNDYYAKKKHDGSPAVADVYFEDGKEVTADEFCTDYWFKRAKEFVRDSVRRKKRFFCYLPLNAAHGPFNAPHGGKSGFDGLVENIDVNMGRLDAFLDREGLKDDVLVIFTTDNGTAGSRFGGLRGRKGSHYDGGHNVPCFWRWKRGGFGGSKETARDINSLTAVADLLPTFIDMFELKKPKGGRPLHGISLKEMALNPDYTPTPRSWVVDTQRGTYLVEWKRACVMQDVVKDGKIVNKWRLIRGSEDGDFQVYDFASDRNQKKNLMKTQPDSGAAVVEELSAVYDEWWSEISPGQEAFPPSVLGVTGEETLFSHDWFGQGASPWNQNLVKKAAGGSRASSVRFDKSGRYRFELRRWPREEGSAITASDKTGEGKVLSSIVKAALEIDGIGEWSNPVEPDDVCSTFEVDVKAGAQTVLTSAFLDRDDKVICGAYYIYVRAL